MPPVLVAVDLRSGVRALASAMSVLHARAVDVADLTYSSNEGGATLDIRVNARLPEVELLVRQLERRVDVIGAHIGPTLHACTGSSPPASRRSTRTT